MKASVRRLSGFTLVEMMVGMVVSVILIGTMLVVMSQLSSTVRTVDNKINAFQSAEAGFDLMTQKLSDATLNTYYDYNSTTAPTAYLRRSDLHFLIEQNSNLSNVFPSANPNSGQSIFFQVPAGYSNNSTYANTSGLLNACGYFIQFGPNKPYWPSIFTTGMTVHYRYRLMQAIQSTEFNGIYGDPETATQEGGTGVSPMPATPLPWFASLGTSASPVALPIAENVIGLYIWPQSPAVTGGSISTDYQYSSRQGFPTPVNSLQAEQLPQILQITLVAIDPVSATRLDTSVPTPPAVIENALAHKFTSTTAYASDLQTLGNALTAAHVGYHVLTTSVTLRESKWSNGQ